MTWVIADHAAVAAGELTVHKGQQVEVVEVREDWCLVRMPTSGSAVDSPPEGLVPTNVLKQPPKATPAVTASSHELGEYHKIMSLHALVLAMATYLVSLLMDSNYTSCIVCWGIHSIFYTPCFIMEVPYQAPKLGYRTSTNSLIVGNRNLHHPGRNRTAPRKLSIFV